MLELEHRILTEIDGAHQQHDDWRSLDLTHHGVHLAVMAEPFLSLITAGIKTVESRFSIHRLAPYHTVQPGDLILMKAGPIIGCFTAAWVEYCDLMTVDLHEVQQKYSAAVGGDDNFWQQKAKARYATLIGIDDVRPLSPVDIPKKDRRGWISLRRAI